MVVWSDWMGFEVVDWYKLMYEFFFYWENLFNGFGGNGVF